MNQPLASPVPEYDPHLRCLKHPLTQVFYGSYEDNGGLCSYTSCRDCGATVSSTYETHESIEARHQRTLEREAAASARESGLNLNGFLGAH